MEKEIETTKGFFKKISSLLSNLAGLGGKRVAFAALVLSAVSLVLSILDLKIFGVDLAWVAVLLCGVPIVLEALAGLFDSFDIRAGVLVSAALFASVATGEIFAAGEVAFIMQLGELLEDFTVSRARKGIARLVSLTPETANVVRSDGRVDTVPASQLSCGQVLRVLPGERIPADGVIIRGETSIDQSVMTGESLPVDKNVGDDVISGTVNLYGSFDMRAVQVGEDSSISRMVRLVQSADAGKAKVVKGADRWATYIVIAAIAAALLTWAVSGELMRAVTILVVFCPCSLVLATPTAIMAAIGNASKNGFLVKEGDALERLSAVSTAAFDKTGTLTHGRPEVCEVIVFNGTRERLLSLAAGAETRSEHPLGKALLRYCESNGITPVATNDFAMLPGRGVCADSEYGRILAGNALLLSENRLAVGTADAEKLADSGCSLIYTALDDELLGIIAFSDTLRDGARDTVNELRNAGVEPVLLTGDRQGAASRIAADLGITEYMSECMPEDKLKRIQTAEQNGRRVCMTGDGINDAPALKTSHVGLAMGVVGSDIALQAADIVLVGDELSKLGHLLKLSKRMMKTIRVNISFSMILNFAAVILAAANLLNPVTGALVHNAGSVLVIANAALLLNFRSKNYNGDRKN